jgi:hypothetical protein
MSQTRPKLTNAAMVMPTVAESATMLYILEHSVILTILDRKLLMVKNSRIHLEYDENRCDD